MKPNFRKVSNDRAVLLENFQMTLHPIVGTKIEIFIPAGFWWDGASVPFPARWLIGDPFQDEFIVPSLIHDWYCDNTKTTIARTLADAVFWELLRIERVPRWKRFAMWFGVRFWSLLFWRLLR